MNDQSRSYRYLIYFLFLASGISGLIYQIVWTRMLVLVFGNTMLATATVLSAFMGGLAAGSYVLGRYIDRKPRPLVQVYSVLEAGIGIFGLLFPLVIALATPLYSAIYPAIQGNIVALNLVRFAVCFAIIVVPTFLMGGTLPVLIKRFSGPGTSIGHQTGFLYGLNTVGAVLGTIACGYFMLRVLGMQKTTWVAVAINLSVAAAAWFLGRRAAEAPVETVPVTDDVPAPSTEPAYSSLTTRLVLVGIGISGFCALAYEVFWTRMLNLFLHNNVYSFTAILATFLIGIALGSLFYARFLAKSPHQLKIFVWLQIGIGAISYATPYIFRTFHASLFNNFNESLTLAKTMAIMLGPTIMMGIAVPLAIQICQRGRGREGTSVGTVYAVNTVGAILGAFMAGFVLLPTVGLHRGVIIVASLNMLAACLPYMSTLRPRLRPALAAGYVVLVVVIALPASGDLFKGLFQAAHPFADILHYKEGKVANVLVYDFKKLGYKDFHLNAVEEASSRLWHVQLFKMLGILPTLVHEEPDDAIMIAFGAGMSAGATATNVNTLEVVDLNPDIQGIAEIFTRENLDVINQPNFTQIVNDGRNALALSDRQYSLIISDATNPKMFDSWTLYSQEFYQLVKSRLKPGGVFCQWLLIPLPGDSIHVILNTFRSVFPHMSFWSIHGSSQVLMLGTPERLEIDYADLATRLEPLYEKTGLREFGIDTPEKFLSFFLVGEDGATRMLAGFDKVSTDDLPHAQFHIEQDREGTDNCLDLVRYQESITDYMSDASPVPADFVRTMAAYEDMARRMNTGFLTGNNLKYAESAVVADDAGLDDANVAHALDFCPERKRHFQARLVDHPEDVTAHNWVGNIQLLSGDYDEAEAAFLRTLELRPDHAYARFNLAMTMLATGRYDEAVEGFLAAREMSQTRGILQRTSQQLGIARILRKLQYEPGSADLHRALGIAYYNEGRILDAMRAYRQAVILSGNDPSTMYNLARICENHEFIAEGARLLGQLAAMRPNDAVIGAKSELFTALDRDPAQRRAWLNGRLFIPEDQDAAGQHPASCDEALAIWNDFDRDGSTDPADLRRAAELYVRSTGTKPEDIHAYTDAAILFEALGDYERAAEMWHGAAVADPQYAIAPLHESRTRAMAALAAHPQRDAQRAALLRDVARHFRGIGESERALLYLNDAVEIAPEVADAWADIAETAAEAGRFTEAVAAADQALALQPGLERAERVRDRLAELVTG